MPPNDGGTLSHSKSHWKTFEENSMQNVHILEPTSWWGFIQLPPQSHFTQETNKATDNIWIWVVSEEQKRE